MACLVRPLTFIRLWAGVHYADVALCNISTGDFSVKGAVDDATLHSRLGGSGDSGLWGVRRVGRRNRERAKISFQRVQIDPVFRAEGVAVADFNGDGRKDIAAGSVYYTAPDWKMHSILAEPKAFSPDSYSDAFCCFADDVNGDGRADLIVVDIPGKPTCWFENPGSRRRPGSGTWRCRSPTTRARSGWT